MINLILENLYTNGTFGVVLIQTLFSTIVLWEIFIHTHRFLREDFRISDEMEKKLLNYISIGNLFIIVGIRLIFENIGYETDVFLFFAIQSLIYTSGQLIYIKTQYKNSKHGENNQKIFLSYLKLNIFVSCIFWLIEIINFIAKIANFKIRDKFRWGFFLCALLELILGIIVIIANGLLNNKRRFDKYVVHNALIITTLITYGIWAFQLTFFGLFGAFVNYYLFFPFDFYIFIIIAYIVIITISLKRIQSSYMKFIKEEISNSMKIINNKSIQEKEEIILDVQKLKTYFYTEEGIVKAVEDVSFKIKHNEVLGLVGETGCGKSVSALSVLQMVPPPGKILDGKVLFLGEDLLKKSANEILKYRGAKITMIFQDPINSVNPVYKAGDQIAEVYILHKKKELYEVVAKNLPKIQKTEQRLKENKKQLKKLNSEILKHKKIESQKQGQLEKDKEEKERNIKVLSAQLTELMKFSSIYSVAREWGIELLKNIGIAQPEVIYDRYPHELSGGMRQRIMIAMGLACSPKLLIADEPTTALDVTIQAQILKLMIELREKYETSILYITHDLGVISKICDRVAVMYSGFIVENTDVHSLFSNPLHPYSKGLISAIPSVESKKKYLPIIKGNVPNLIYPPSGCRFHPRCKYAFEPCSKERPKQYLMGENHTVSCFLYDPQYKTITEESRKELRKNQINNLQN
ncbi:MAG: oligopeptide/dipeptide ABC transporter ATP-binding protein [Promethearchaeota archaeon]